MRAEEPRQPVLFSYVSLEDRVPKSHPLRKLRVLVDGILASMDKEFDAVYSNNRRPWTLSVAAPTVKRHVVHSGSRMSISGVLQQPASFEHWLLHASAENEQLECPIITAFRFAA